MNGRIKLERKRFMVMRFRDNESLYHSYGMTKRSKMQKLLRRYAEHSSGLKSKGCGLIGS